MAAIEKIGNFRVIDGLISLGGQPSEPQLGTLAAAGTAVVINLGLHDDRRYALPDEAASVRALGMVYVHIPVLFDAPSAANFQAFCAAMESHRGQKTFIHCAANKRATVFYALYRTLIHGNGNGSDTAFASMRSVWEPNEVWANFIGDRLASG